MSDLDLARAGLDAWRRGDFEALELLAPDATWRAVEPDEWDCQFPAEVGGTEWPDETAIVVTFRDGRVVAMQDCSTLADARRAL